MVKRSVKLVLQGAFEQQGVRKSVPHRFQGYGEGAYLAWSVLQLRQIHIFDTNNLLTLRILQALMQQEDLFILILTSHLWGNEHPYIHKSENFRFTSSVLIITSLATTLAVLFPFTSSLTLSVLFHSLLFLPLPASSFLFTSRLFTLTSLLLAWFPLPSPTSTLFLFALYARYNEFQICSCSRWLG